MPRRFSVDALRFERSVINALIDEFLFKEAIAKPRPDFPNCRHLLPAGARRIQHTGFLGEAVRLQNARAGEKMDVMISVVPFFPGAWTHISTATP